MPSGCLPAQRLLVTSRSTNSMWESISYTSSLMLLDFSSTALGGFWTGGAGYEKGIWSGFLNGESSGTPMACRTASHPSPNPCL